MNTKKVTAFNVKNYSQFENLKDFIDNYEQMMLDQKDKFTKLQRDVLNIIQKYAAKHVGVTIVPYSHIQKTLQKECGYIVHLDTVARTLKKAESMGILVKIPQKRIDGGTSSNLIIFNRSSEQGGEL